MRHEGPRAQPTSRACWDVSRACRPDVCVPGAVLSPVSYWTGWLRSLAAKTLPSHVRSVRGLVPVDLGQAQALRICLCAWQAELLTPPIGGSKCLPTKLCSRMSPSWHLSSEPAGGPLGLPWDKLARGELSLARPAPSHPRSPARKRHTVRPREMQANWVPAALSLLPPAPPDLLWFKRGGSLWKDRKKTRVHCCFPHVHFDI